ncbi:hypothetical protein WMY93_005080 [Mugilogobius chulae]|uniref:NHR domain-containing protein n=1 Tax=Mugilogobius chulae TaxID=88201 RepID=A0AAW0PST9_9GOBI
MSTDLFVSNEKSSTRSTTSAPPQRQSTDMVKQSRLTLSEVHKCSAKCLGPLVFHSQTKGECIRLSEHGRCAQRNTDTFKNGLLFSCRSVRVQEKVQLRIDKDSLNWTGALRVGFTTVPPSTRTGDLPCMAIPCLTKLPGHWAAPVEHSLVTSGALLEFWVSDSGSLNVCIDNRVQGKLLSGVDISRPLWAMIDVYGQTCGITLLGSVKKELFHTRKSVFLLNTRSLLLRVLTRAQTSHCWRHAL